MMRGNASYCVATAVAALLFQLNAKAVEGDLYVGAIRQNAIFTFSRADRHESTFALNLTLRAMIFDDRGNLFVATDESIEKITPAGVRTTFAPNTTAVALTFDAQGNLFASVAGGIGAILKFKADGTKSTVASDLPNPGGIAIDRFGNLYLGKKGQNAILKFAPDGTRTKFASGMLDPRSLVFDTKGDLLVADVEAETIYRINPAGETSIFTSDVSDLGSLAFDRSGNLFATAGESVYAVTLSGVPVPFASIPGGAGPLAVEPPVALTLNLSSRLRVLGGERVLVGGFIITGKGPKTVMIRGLGPSLENAAVPGPLSDPMIELKGDFGTFTNDDWRDTQAAAIAATGIAPPDDREAAIVATLPPGSYTVTERGKNDSTGVGLVEIYDLDPAAKARLANISTRGFVAPSSNAILISGLIIGGGADGDFVFRAIGPSLTAVGIVNALPDPTLSVYDASGTQIASNDNWQVTQRAQIETSGLAPTDAQESAIVMKLHPSNYTAIVSSSTDGEGVALLEVYQLQ